MIKTLVKDSTGNLPVLIAGIVVALLALTALFSPLLTAYVIKQDPLAMDLDSLRVPPGKAHLLGTDSKGRDILSRIIAGSRISLAVGLAATALSLTIGVLLGLAAGYFGGAVDAVLSQIFDVFLAFPSLLLAIGISAVLQPGLASAMLAITLVSWAGFARLVRGIALSLREQTYVEASRALGASSARILFRHILPNALPLLLVAASLRVGGFILLEAALSFLGLGVQPPTPTWGSMISLNRAYISSAPWTVLFPGLTISVSVIAFNIIGDYLRDKLDPRFQA
ncbi:MAG: ABC transporter permease [Nitrospiraceae bacterium]|nr:ABC transporter permease [Nitrospiraceae bacterium]